MPHKENILSSTETWCYVDELVPKQKETARDTVTDRGEKEAFFLHLNYLACSSRTQEAEVKMMPRFRAAWATV